MTVLAVFAGCSLPRGENLLDATAVKATLEQRLGIALSEVEPPGNAAFANVAITYSGRSLTESIHVVVFTATAATDQLAPGEPAAGVIREQNVVVLYRRDPQGPNRTAAIRESLSALRLP